MSRRHIGYRPDQQQALVAAWAPLPTEGPPVRPERLSTLTEALASAAARLTRDPAVRGLDHVLSEIVSGAVAAVPGATHAGLTVLEQDGRLTSTAPTGELVERLDQAQAALGEGPCVTAVSTSPTETDGRPVAVVRVDDMTTEAADGGRWPRFAPEAVRNEINSLISVQLLGGRRQVVALNLYAQHPRVFDDEAETVARLFADQASIALHGARQADSLNQAVASRDVIGQAKGILIERHRVTETEAFAMLVRASQDTNIKLVDVARWLVSQTAPDPAASTPDRSDRLEPHAST